MMTLLLVLACQSDESNPKGQKTPDTNQNNTDSVEDSDGPGEVEDPVASVELLSPASGARLPYTLTFQAEASMISGEAGEVAEIEYWVDAERVAGGAPGERVVARASTPGTVQVTAVAVDAAGNELGSDQIEVEVGVGLNAEVLAMLNSYPTDGTNGYWWPEDDGVWWGTTEDVWYLGQLLSPGDAYGRCYCVGLTWEVAMAVLAEKLGGTDVSINGISVAEMDEFRIDWFVRFVWGSGPVEAVTNYGVGEWVQDLDRVEAGDFIQFWRNNESGHNAIFIGWTYDNNGNIEGFRYWSTQSSTDGISENTEEFGSGSSEVREDLFYVARLWNPIDWTEGGSSF